LPTPSGTPAHSCSAAKQRRFSRHDPARRDVSARTRHPVSGSGFRTRPGLAEGIRDLAAREKACCAFFEFDIREHDDEITWDASVVDDPLARHILDEYYALPDTLVGSVAELFDRFAANGLEIVVGDNGVMRPATDTDLGVAR